MNSSKSSTHKNIILTSKTTIYVKDEKGKYTCGIIKPEESYVISVDSKMTEHILFSSKPEDVITQIKTDKGKCIRKEDLTSSNWIYSE
ncbi:MAG: hypothetical protein HDS30_06965 [Bacteroides sp.]|nr:hypothetical protein [Bacteroides sp.]